MWLEPPRLFVERSSTAFSHHALNAYNSAFRIHLHYKYPGELSCPFPDE
jgi:hypothetical protein